MDSNVPKFLSPIDSIRFRAFLRYFFVFWWLQKRILVFLSADHLQYTIENTFHIELYVFHELFHRGGMSGKRIRFVLDDITNVLHIRREKPSNATDTNLEENSIHQFLGKRLPQRFWDFLKLGDIHETILKSSFCRIERLGRYGQEREDWKEKGFCEGCISIASRTSLLKLGSTGSTEFP